MIVLRPVRGGIARTRLLTRRVVVGIVAFRTTGSSGLLRTEVLDSKEGAIFVEHQGLLSRTTTRIRDVSVFNPIGGLLGGSQVTRRVSSSGIVSVFLPVSTRTRRGVSSLLRPGTLFLVRVSTVRKVSPLIGFTVLCVTRKVVVLVVIVVIIIQIKRKR